jgi:multidrug efflux pump
VHDLEFSAVFLPMAFFGGSVGVIYQQSSITIVASMALSVVVALVLTPALTATLLKRRERAANWHIWVAKAHEYGDRFNAWFADMSDKYRANVIRTIKRPRWPLIGYRDLVALLVLLFWLLPSSFLPVED